MTTDYDVREDVLDRFADDMDALVLAFMEVVRRYGHNDDDARFDR